MSTASSASYASKIKLVCIFFSLYIPISVQAAEQSEKAASNTKPISHSKPVPSQKDALWDDVKHQHHLGDFNGDGQTDVVLQSRLAGEPHRLLTGILDRYKAERTIRT